MSTITFRNSPGKSTGQRSPKTQFPVRGSLNLMPRTKTRVLMRKSGNTYINKGEKNSLFATKQILHYRYSLLGEYSERFTVDPETGEVFTVVPLDREQTSVYHLTLVAQDSSPTEPQASAVNLTIFVKDVNDNAPRFSSPRYTAYVPGATKSGKGFLETRKTKREKEKRNGNSSFHPSRTRVRTR